MKNFRILAIALVCVFAMNVFAQQAQTAAQPKDYSEYLPEAGDMAISLNLAPFLNVFADNAIDGRIGGDSYNSDLISIAAKYMVTDNFAVRLNVGWSYLYNRDNYYVQDDAAVFLNPLSQAKVTDSYITKNSGASITAAAEYRFGSRRIQGYVGGGLTYALSYYSMNLYYGNAMTELNQNPTTYEDYSAYIPGFASARYTKVANNGLDFNHHAGVVAFLGFEWFVAKKVSVGAEVNISAIASWGNVQYATLEGYNTLSEKVETWTELFKPSSFAVDFGTQNVGANLSVNFYF